MSKSGLQVADVVLHPSVVSGISPLGETSLKPESPFSSTGINVRKEDSHKIGSSSQSHSNPNADNMSNRTTRDKNLKTSLELSGYNPKRHEFDIEYDNDAEQLLVDMEFKDTDTPEEHETKLRILRCRAAKLHVNPLHTLIQCSCM